MPLNSESPSLSTSRDWFNKVRWQMAFSLAILITAFSSLLHKNFSYQNQIIDLQDHISKLSGLQACNLVDSVDIINSIPQESDHLPNRSLKISVLIVLFTILSIPFLFFMYVEHVSKSRRSSSDNIAEEVSLNKQLAYRVDVFFSVYPYAKPLALLIATLLLICLGGLALFGVTDDSLADSLWLSWTYVADSGNHANSEGVGPRLVSVSISFGGMLIFAMMLGLVSDAISEKLDSLRKGRSEVVEQNHTLILGWSDKLGSLLNQLAMANESLGGGIVVVMAERDKEEMETDIAKMEFDFRGTSVISRSGSPLILADLKKAKRPPYREAKTIQRHRGSISQGSWGGEMQQASDKLCRKEQAKRLLYRKAKTIQQHRGSISQGSWGGEMQQASDKSVIISEILDPRTKNLLSMLEISDYVLSNELVSMVLAMVAEDRQINDVLEELFAEGGNEMHIRQADLYLQDGEELSFYEVLLRARQRREIVIGYRLANAEKAVINPPGKNEKRRWSPRDVFVVIAKNE